MFRSIVDDEHATVDFNNEAIIYFGEENKMLGRESLSNTF